MSKPSAVCVIAFFFVLVGVVAHSVAAETDDLRVLVRDQAAVAPEKQLYAFLLDQAQQALDRRRQTYEALKTPEQIADYQRRLRDNLIQSLGGFPEPTPLNARVVATLSGAGFRVEKVLFESRPQHHVSALVYLPDAPPPYPGVVIPCGHSNNGKAADYNQRIGIILAKHGLAAICYDPIGQGERSQLLKPDGTRKLGGSTTEHFLVGLGALLVGGNTAAYRAYDGIRVIDYLASRPDIDAARIGVTGCSGGGTVTSYLMALDDRVACAAPACYITSFGRLLATIGPQDAEQNVFGQLGYGLDHPDYLLIRAPKPTLIASTTQDFFDIQGTWDTFRQAKRLYGRLGFAERVDLIEIEGKHGVPRASREAIARWMRRWLLGKDDAVTEPDVKLFPESELFCTPNGQVLRLEGERSAFDLNADLARTLATHREQRWRDVPADVVREAARAASGVRPLKELPAPRVSEVGKLMRGAVRVEKLVLEPERGVSLPSLLFRPEGTPRGGVLYLSDAGLAVDAGDEGPVMQHVRAGRLVLAADLRGFGETAPGKNGSQLGPDWKEFYVAYLLGRSLVALRTEDALACARYLAQQLPEAARGIEVVGVGKAGIPALHAAALEPELVTQVRVRGTLRSWTDVVLTPETNDQFGSSIHGVLKTYDLPDLERLCGRDRVTIEAPVVLVK